MAAHVDDIAALAGKVGSRPAGGSGERYAAHYAVERLRQLQIPATTLPVRVPRGVTVGYTALVLLSVVSVALARWWLLVALAASVAALLLTAVIAFGSRRPGGWPLGRGSHNVVGLIPPRTPQPSSDGPDTTRRVILTAHLDSGRSGRLWRPPLVRHLRLLLSLSLVSLVAVPLLQGVQILSGSDVPWLVSLAPGAILLVGFLLLVDTVALGRPVTGANDNASGIATVLAVATMLQHRRPRHVETWVLLTAGAETGQAGMRQFLAENRFDPDRTYFICLDSVGAGGVRFTRSDGGLIRHPSSPVLQRVASEIVRTHPDWGVLPADRPAVPTDQGVALAEGYQAIGIFAADRRGLIPNWRQTTDTIERIEGGALATAAEFTLAMVRRLDAEASEQRPHRGPKRVEVNAGS